MGQHKYNPTAIKAKNGELEQKPKKMGKRETERILYAKMKEVLCKPFTNVHMEEYYK